MAGRNAFKTARELWYAQSVLEDIIKNRDDEDACNRILEQARLAGNYADHEIKIPYETAVRVWG